MSTVYYSISTVSNLPSDSPWKLRKTTRSSFSTCQLRPPSISKARYCLYDRAKHLAKKTSVIKEKGNLSSVLVSNGFSSSFDRTIHRVTFNHNRASSAEVLRVPVPKPNNSDVLLPASFSLIFDSAVSGHANSYIVNNVSRALVDRLTVKFAEIIAQDNDVYDLYKFYEDLLLTENERASIFREVIQSFER